MHGNIEKRHQILNIRNWGDHNRYSFKLLMT